jgi:hypothetical protein
MNTKAEVIENLVLADQYIGTLFPDMKNLKLVITGGASFLLKGYESKFTLDIDTISDLDLNIQEYLESFGINNAAREISKISKTYSSRLLKLNSKCKILQVYFLSHEDLILTKLNRSSYDDLFDITSSGILDSCDLELLEKIALEMCEGDPVYESKWLHFKKTFL